MFKASFSPRSHASTITVRTPPATKTAYASIGAAVLVLTGTAFAQSNINDAYVANEGTANQINPDFAGPHGGTVSIGVFGDVDSNSATPATFITFTPGDTPAGDHDNVVAGNANVQGFLRHNNV